MCDCVHVGVRYQLIVGHFHLSLDTMHAHTNSLHLKVSNKRTEPCKTGSPVLGRKYLKDYLSPKILVVEMQ